ncbi:MAG: hypothetical protein AAF735_02470 [Myxococcota bacterium]
MDDSDEVLLARIDGSGSDSEWEAIDALRERLGVRLAEHLLALYKKSRSWKPRSACVYHSTRFARESDSAIELGVLALDDKSQTVRYRACLLLAYSLKKALLPRLYARLDSIRPDTRQDLEAAIDAIQHKNHHYFVDREHSGQMTLNIA